jgi:hypothetical protein
MPSGIVEIKFSLRSKLFTTAPDWRIPEEIFVSRLLISFLDMCYLKKGGQKYESLEEIKNG